MLSLTGQDPASVEVNGKRCRVNIDAGTVLRFFKLQADDLFFPHERAAIAAAMFIGPRRARRLSVEQQAAVVGDVYTQFLAPVRAADDGGPRLMDYDQDAPLIYAAFMQTYGIDLERRLDFMDWRVFQALLAGLPDDTRLHSVISLRARDIPAPTQHNAAEIAALMKAKAAVALRLTEDEAERSFQRGVDRLAAGLIRRAQAAEKGGE